jgi:hypothetical protein
MTLNRLPCVYVYILLFGLIDSWCFFLLWLGTRIGLLFHDSVNVGIQPLLSQLQKLVLVNPLNEFINRKDAILVVVLVELRTVAC